jgi:hypothetical protein
VMSDPLTLGRSRLRGTDVHPPVHLHAVDRDQLDVIELAGDGDRDLRLTGGGRPDDRDPPNGGSASAQKVSPPAIR